VNAKDSHSSQVKECSPHDGFSRREDTGGDNGRNGIRGVMESVQEIEDECDKNDKNNEGEHVGSEGWVYPCLI
jgi:hypothetical protein